MCKCESRFEKVGKQELRNHTVYVTVLNFMIQLSSAHAQFHESNREHPSFTIHAAPDVASPGTVYIAFRKSKIGKRVVVAVWPRVFTNIESYDLIIMPPCIRNKVARSITVFGVYVSRSRLIINQPAPKLENEEHTSNHISSHLLNTTRGCVLYFTRNHHGIYMGRARNS